MESIQGIMDLFYYYSFDSVEEVKMSEVLYVGPKEDQNI